jgi:hypothetical protein
MRDRPRQAAAHRRPADINDPPAGRIPEDDQLRPNHTAQAPQATQTRCCPTLGMSMTATLPMSM